MCFEAMRMREVAKYIGKDEVLIIDLRDKKDYMKGHIPGAINFLYDESDDIQEWCVKAKQMMDLYEERRNIKIKQVLLYCERGNSSILVARYLNKEYGKIFNLYGGYCSYRGPVERKCIN